MAKFRANHWTSPGSSFLREYDGVALSDFIGFPALNHLWYLLINIGAVGGSQAGTAKPRKAKW